ncbi:uncharacterized protein DEA37_0004564 [Paragonimus westermani]|uniref:Uncharacterized protein n=1 Tax=Paragonimus westermani TaxID=34504 RepID=A0A5J4N3F5_9TREM|nr:uncharacterized protein DEA37_0004564 [Paragonimus westermani]
MSNLKRCIYTTIFSIICTLTVFIETIRSYFLSCQTRRTHFDLVRR